MIRARLRSLGRFLLEIYASNTLIDVLAPREVRLAPGNVFYFFY
jgi:hypothetical protein